MVVTNAFLPEFIGGAEIAAEALLREWRLRGVSVSLFVGAPSPFAKTIRATEKRYEGVPAVAVRYPLSRLAGDQEGFVSETVESLFAHTLAAFRPTIVHFHNLAGLSVRLPRIARSIGARTVQTLHDYGAFCARNTLLHRSGAMCGDTSRCAGCAPAIQTESEGAVPAVFRRHLYEHFARDVDLFLAPSQYALAQFKDAWRSIVRIEHFSNGYPSATTYEGADMRDERLSVFVGYLGAHKGADLVVKAFQEVVRVIPSARLEIAGDGEERMSLERQVQALGLVGAVSFRGSLPRAAVAALWRRAGTLVVGSKWPENAPVSIAEAMSAGTIVIAPRCGGIPEMVADKRTGMLYEAENIEHLTSVWLSTLGDRGQREAVAIGAQRQAATESYSVQADALLRRFAELEDTPRASDSKMDSRSGMVLAGCAHQLMQGEGSAAILDLIFRERQAVRAEWLFDEDLQGRKIAVLGSSDYAGRAVVRLLAAGLPILAPRGWRHAKTLAEAGCLLEYGTVDGLAAALQLLDEDPALIDAMRANALFALRQPCVLKTLADGY
jgi:glycosyltransferase involved in cell wall biosynthesis